MTRSICWLSMRRKIPGIEISTVKRSWKTNWFIESVWDMLIEGHARWDEWKSSITRSLYNYIFIAILYIYILDIFFFDICTLAYILSTWMGICRGNHEGLGVGFSNQKCMYCLPGGVTCILGNRSKDPLIPSNPKQQPVITFFNSRTEKLLIHSRKFLIFRIQDQNNRTLMYDTSVYVILKYIYIYLSHMSCM